MNKIFITDSIIEANLCEKIGVQSVMIDLETNGKKERQKRKDSRISSHNKKNIKRISKELNRTNLIVRINPFCNRTHDEVSYAIDSGADSVMLPMFDRLSQIEKTLEYINGKTKLIPLFETLGSIKASKQILALNEIQTFHIGLNDLHLESKKNFMFSVISEGLIDNLLENNINKKQFGIGGVGPITNNKNLLLDPKEILKIHKFYNSSIVILSRSFNDLIHDINSFNNAIRLMDKYWDKLGLVHKAEIQKIFNKINQIEKHHGKESA